MIDDGLDRGSSYRRRLARAAAASVALHMIFFGGLSVSRLDLTIERPADAEAETPEKRKKPADFRLQVSRSTQAQRPAHERPLTLPVPTDAARPAEARKHPTERSITERREVAPEAEPTVTPSQTEFERTRPAEQAEAMRQTEAIDRVAEITPTESRATADMAAAAAATEAAASSATAPASAQPRDRGEAGPIAARWRPREVALLEKLTVRAPDASSIAARPVNDAPAPPRATAISRRSTANAARPSIVRADAVTPAATEASSSAPAASPQARDTPRRPSPASSVATQPALPAASSPASSTAIATVPTALTSVTRSQATTGAAGSTGSAASASAGSRSPARATGVKAGDVAGAATASGVSGAPLAVASSSVGGPLAPAARASGGSRSGRQGSRGSATGERSAVSGGGRNTSGTASAGSGTSGITAGALAGGGANALGDVGGSLTGGREGLAGGSDGTTTGSTSPGRDTGSLASGPPGAGGLVAVDPTGGGGLGAGGGTGQAAAGSSGPGGAGTGLMPAAIDRGGRRGSSRSAVASRGSGRGDGDSASEGLSVTPADIAAVVAAGRQRAASSSQPQRPRSPERITAAALPTDGRVRDVAEAFAGRSGGGSEPAGGITDRETLDRARAMVDRGLAFLVRSQLPDGRWKLTQYAGVTPDDVPKLESDTAATGLALLCFLGAGHDHFSGPHRDTVRRGLEFLMASQQEDGDLFVPADDLSNSCGWLYSHGIASIAVCEAVGMTGDPLVKPAAEKACRFITTSRHPTLGGWRYVPRTDADLSVSGWMLVALRAGDLAGVKTDAAALDGVRMLVDVSSSLSDPTRYAYNARKADQRRTDLSVACMTAVGTLMRLHTGGTADDPRVIASAKLLAAMPPAYGTRSQRVRDSYLWYYASQVLVHTGGDGWQAWYASLVDTLEANQRETGPLAGSWDAMGDVPDRWGEYGGRLYVTTLHILALEVPWRHLPTYATAPSR